MKWNEMSGVQKVFSVVGLLSGLLFWILFCLSALGVLKNISAILCGLMAIHCLYQAYIGKIKVFKIIWSVIAVTSFVMLGISCYLLIAQ